MKLDSNHLSKCRRVNGVLVCLKLYIYTYRNLYLHIVYYRCVFIYSRKRRHVDTSTLAKFLYLQAFSNIYLNIESKELEMSYSAFLLAGRFSNLLQSVMEKNLFNFFNRSNHVGNLFSYIEFVYRNLLKRTKFSDVRFDFKEINLFILLGKEIWNSSFTCGLNLKDKKSYGFQIFNDLRLDFRFWVHGITFNKTSRGFKI